MSEPIDRRHFLGVAAAAGLAGQTAAAAPGGRRAVADPRPSRPFLTEAGDFVDVSRGNPKPFKLQGEALAKARLTTETWRLEVVSDGSTRVERPACLGDGTALDLAKLKELGKAHGVKYL